MLFTRLKDIGRLIPISILNSHRNLISLGLNKSVKDCRFLKYDLFLENQYGSKVAAVVRKKATMCAIMC